MTKSATEFYPDGDAPVLGPHYLCTQINGRCVGYHCPYCGRACSSMGHRACLDYADALRRQQPAPS